MQKKYQIIALSFFGLLIFHVAGAQETAAASAGVPWAWYLSRAAGFLAFALLYVSIFLGLTLRIPLLRKIFAPARASYVHCWISLQATLIVFLHAGVLVFDNFFHLTWQDLFVPFASSYQTIPMALGIFGFYLMVVLVATSYGKKYISRKVWRWAHSANVILYVIVLLHVFYLGIDMQNPVVFNVFLWANAFLVFLMLTNMQLRIGDNIRMKNARALRESQNK